MRAYAYACVLITSASRRGQPAAASCCHLPRWRAQKRGARWLAFKIESDGARVCERTTVRVYRDVQNLSSCGRWLLCMCMCTSEYLNCIQACMCGCTYAYVHVCMHVYLRLMCEYVCMYARMYVCMYVIYNQKHKHIHSNTYMNTDIRVCIRIYTHLHTSTHNIRTAHTDHEDHKYTYVYTFWHTCANTRIWRTYTRI